MHLRYFSVWGEGLCGLMQVPSSLSAPNWETEGMAVCGWGLGGVSLVSSLPDLSESQDHPNEYQSEEKQLYIFSSADICYGILHK